jgi:hypothetical protein
MSSNKPISYEYIRGLIDGEGCFTFCTSKYTNKNGMVMKRKIPTFSLAMHERDKELITAVRDVMGIKNKLYLNKNNHHGDNYNHGQLTMLIVREIGNIKNIIVPFFYGRLHGYKAKQFQAWLEKMGTDPEVPNSFRFIYKISKAGFYDKNPKYLD